MQESGSADTPPAGAVRIGRQEFSVGGYGYGLRQPFLKFQLSVQVPDDYDWSIVDKALASVIPASDSGEPAPVTANDRVIHWTSELQRAGGQPVLERGRMLGQQAGRGQSVLALPTMNVEAASAALAIVTGLIGGLVDGVTPQARVVADARSQAKKFIDRYSNVRTGGSNTPLFFRAAFENRMPCFNLAGDVLQVGMGSKSRWLESTLSDVTPAIAMRLARNKLATADLLRQGGMPVPLNQLVRTADEAVAVANRIGYPVVVKPVDRDGGVAVAAGLTDDDRVRDAFEAARKMSGNVMVEQHVHGLDYRLVVYNGRMIWALERVAGGVTGDGVSTVAQLIERLNAEPARAERSDSPLKPLKFDREAAELLESYGMTTESVPAKGERVRLRRAANVASGGTPEAAFDRVHPDNARLAERAAALLRLDIAGIDLLIPDIARSWLESGAAICEVNAQPTLGNTTSKHLYGEILKSMIPGDGRIPIVMIVGADQSSSVPSLVARILGASGLRTTIASAHQAVNGERILHASPRNVFDAARAGLIDRGTDALVVVVSDMTVLSSALPFDRCSTIVLAGNHIAGAPERFDFVTALSRLLLPISLGGICAAAGASAWRPVLRQLVHARVVMSSAGEDMASVREHVSLGREAVILERAGDVWRLDLGAERIDVDAPRAGAGSPAPSPEDVAAAAAAVLSMGWEADAIRRGLSGLRVARSGAAA
ncbi:MAG: acetate--CoA ligase family protein [Sphingomonadales bacterium]